MADNPKALLAKAWKNEAVDLEPGRHVFDEVMMVRVSGTVERQVDPLVAPTVSIPLILTLPLFWEKSRIARDHALQVLREAIAAMIFFLLQDVNLTRLQVEEEEDVVVNGS